MDSGLGKVKFIEVSSEGTLNQLNHQKVSDG